MASSCLALLTCALVPPPPFTVAEPCGCSCSAFYFGRTVRTAHLMAVVAFGLTQGECTEFAEIYTKKMAGEHMFHGKTGKYLTF